MWTLRTKRTGGKALAEDYKTEILRKLLTIDEPIGSGKMYTHLLGTMGENYTSRASVIFFLNALVEYEYAKFNDATGKGGHHKLYYTDLSKTEFIEKIDKNITDSLLEAISEIFY